MYYQTVKVSSNYQCIIKLSKLTPFYPFFITSKLNITPSFLISVPSQKKASLFKVCKLR